MPNTDLDKALAKRIGLTSEDSHSNISNKLNDVLEARLRKTDELNKYVADSSQRTAAKQKSYDGSFMGNLGLDPESFTGKAANALAQTGSTLHRMAGEAQAAPFSLIGISDELPVSDAAKEAYQRYLKNEPTKEDIELLTKPAGGFYDRRTNIERLASTHFNINEAKKIRENWDASSAVYRGYEQDFNNQLLGENADSVAGLGESLKQFRNKEYASSLATFGKNAPGLLKGMASAAVDNPTAVAGFMAENIPQLLAGGVFGKLGTAAVTGGYALSELEQAISDYQSKNGGKLPTREEMEDKKFLAATLGIAEFAGDRLDLGIAGVANKAAKSITKGVDAATEGMSREALKKMLRGTTALSVDNPVSRVALGAGIGATAESLVEGYQTATEEAMKGKQASAEDIYKGAAAGFAGSGGITGSLTAAGEVAGTADKAVNKVAEKVAEKEQAKEAAATGNVDAYLDPKSNSYNPAKAISALIGNIQQADATEDSRKASKQKADEVLSTAKEAVNRANDEYALVSPEGRAETAKLLEEFKTKLETITDPALRGDYEGAIAGLEDNLSMPEPPKALVEERKYALDKAKKELSKVETSHADFLTVAKTLEATKPETTPQETLTAESIENHVKAATSPVDVSDTVAVEAAKKSARKIVTLAMAAHESITPEIANQLASNLSNGLDDAQRNYLKAFSVARSAHIRAESRAGVSKQIFNGDPGANQMGIQDYQKGMAKAVRAGNQADAQRLLTGITKFSTSHESKALAMVKAFTTAQKTGKEKFVVRDNAGMWSVADVAPTEGGKGKVLKVGAYSSRVIGDIEAEADALTKAAAAAQAAFDLGFKQKAKPSAQPTQSTQKSAEKAVNPEEGKEVQQTAVEEDQFKGAQSTEAEAKSEHQPEAAVQDTLEQPEAAVSEPQSTEERNTGKLEVLANKSKEGTPYQLENLVAENFVQVGQKSDSKSLRALVAEHNFLSQLFKGEVSVQDFVDETLDVGQVELVNLFATKAKEWQAKIEEAITTEKAVDPARREFAYEDLFNFFINDKGEVAENVKTAISYAVFSYIAENFGEDRQNTKEEINAILLRDEDTLVSDTEQDALGHVGIRRGVVIQSLGQKAVAALGLNLKADSPQDLKGRLDNALGAHAMKLLFDLGYATQTKIEAKEMNALLKERGKTVEYAENTFVKLKAMESEVAPSLAAIKEANYGTRNVLDKVMGAESDVIPPSLKPISFKQKTTRNTKQGIPAFLEKVLKRANAQPYKVHGLKWGVYSKLSEEAALDMAGFEEENEDAIQVTRMASVQAKNDGLKREYSRFMEFVDETLLASKDGLESAMYFAHSVWKQQRVGISTNMVNPQTSKLHRGMLFMPEWETTVNLETGEHLDNFKLRVMEGLGVKTGNASNETSLKMFEAFFDPNVAAEREGADPKDVVRAEILSAAVDSLIAVGINGEAMTEDHEEAIRTGVKYGKEKMHSFDALVGMAEYRHAQETGAKEFTSKVMGEIDGVTNGPMLSMLLFGAAASADMLAWVMQKGGFFTEESGVVNHNIWSEDPNNRDLYKSTIGDVLTVVQEMLGPKSRAAYLSDTFAAIFAITGELSNGDTITKEGRDIIKTPLTAMMFGSSMNRSVESMAEKMIESIYKQIEKLHAEGKDPRELLKNVNRLIDSGNQHLDKKPAPLLKYANTETLMKLELSRAQVEAIHKAFNVSMGRAVKQTMNDNFGTFIERRKQFNTTAELTFRLYDAVEKGMRETYMQELISKGEIATDAKGVPLHDMTKPQEAEFRKSLASIAPVIHSPMSKMSDQLNAGLYISKSARKFSQEAVDRSNNKFATKIPGTHDKAMITRGYRAVNSLPGVGMAPQSVHSLDSAISHMAVLLGHVLNVHDAHVSGLNAFTQSGKNLNEATFKAVMGYSPSREMLEAFGRVVTGTAAILESETVPEAVKKNVSKAIFSFVQKVNKANTGFDGNLREGAIELTTENALITVLSDMSDVAEQADKTKYGFIEISGSFDQYANEGGHYEVTGDDRKKAAELKAAVPTGLNPEIASAAEKITKIVEALHTKETEEEKAESQQDVEDFNEGGPVGTSIWGDLGTDAQANPYMAKVFAKYPTLTGKQLILALNEQLKNKTGNMGEFSLRLLGILNKTLDPNLKIELVTPNTQATDVLAKHDGPARAWYAKDPNTGEARIYVLGTEFKHSGLHIDVLLHELVHSSLYDIIDNEANASQEVKELLAELRILQTKAKEAVAKMDESKQNQFKHAVENLQEMVAWGMTNRAFQVEVLSKVTMRSTTSKNDLVTGMKKFIKAITGLIFRISDKSAQAKAVNGMTILSKNVSGLFLAANQEQSSNRGQTVVVAAHATVNAVLDYSTEEIFDALSEGQPLMPEQDQRLRGLLNGIVQKLHGVAGSLKSVRQQYQALTPKEVFLKAMETGVAPFASEASLSGFRTTAQEAFVMEQVEATLRAALQDNEGKTTVAYNELAKLYREAYSRLKDASKFYEGDWTAASPEAKARAEALRDFLFKMDRGADAKSNHLARFAALGMVNPEVRKLLNFSTSVATRTSDGTILGWLESILNTVLDWFNGKLTHTFAGQSADTKLVTLVDQLVDIEARKRARILASKNRKVMDALEEASDSVAGSVRKFVVKTGTSQFFKNRTNGFVRMAGSLPAAIAGDRAQFIIDGLSELREKHFAGEQQGIIASMVGELKGIKSLYDALLRGAKKNEKLRKEVITGHSKMVLEMFKDQGKKLSQKTKNSLTAVFLRTGAHVLLNDFSMAEVADLLEGNQALDAAIKNYEQALTANKGIRSYYLTQAKTLAYYRATGKTRGSMMMMNAGNIARLYGTKDVGDVTERQAQEAEATLDVLVTLYALKYSDNHTKYLARQALLEENNRTDELGNGVESLLHIHRKLEAESRDRLFSGNEALMQKGYVPEIYDPHVEVRAAKEAEGRDLLAQGWVKMYDLPMDRADTNQEARALYVLKDGGLMPYQSGVFSLTALGTKGFMAEDGSGNKLNHAKITHNKRGAINRMFVGGETFDPTKVSEVFLAPVVNSEGAPVEWRYLMDEQTKDNILNRTNSFEDVIGALAGSIVDKQSTPEHNRKAVQALFDQFKGDVAENGERYLTVGMNSTDPELREIYKMLPKETRDDIVKIWGTEGMRVKADALDVFFGYRKLSASNMFDKAVSDRNEVEKLIVFTLENILTTYASVKFKGDQQKIDTYHRRAGMVMRRGERIWQEIVREIKDIIVVRSGSTLLWNIVSNMTLLKVQGVSVSDMVRSHRVAIKGALAWQKDSDELYQLTQQRDSGYIVGNPTELDRRIVELEDSLARNPVKDLIDGGLMPTIVEDVAADEDVYSYKSQLKRYVDEKTKDFNPTVVSVTKQLLMTKDSKAYQFLHKTTQMSDFVARYTLYQHLTNRKVNPLSKEEALQEASDSFVNYDIPLHRGLQYTDDMGLTPFIKYFFRIQKVLLKTTRENPGRVLLMLALDNWLGNIPNVMDSSLIHHFGNNPFSPGAMQLPFVMDELLTSKMLVGVFK